MEQPLSVGERVTSAVTPVAVAVAQELHRIAPEILRGSPSATSRRNADRNQPAQGRFLRVATTEPHMPRRSTTDIGIDGLSPPSNSASRVSTEVVCLQLPR